MDGPALLARLEETNATALTRLGSEKALLAATEARLEPDPVLHATVAGLSAACETLATWADEIAGTAGADAAAAALGDAAAALANARDRVVATRPGGVERDGIEAPFLRMRAAGPIERVAVGTIAVPLVLDRLFLQSVSFFVNEADSARADLFRDLRGVTDDVRTEGLETLDAICGPDDWERAERAASGAIEAAYDDYVERLEAMGFDPKPIC